MRGQGGERVGGTVHAVEMKPEHVDERVETDQQRRPAHEAGQYGRGNEVRYPAEPEQAEQQLHRADESGHGRGPSR